MAKDRHPITARTEQREVQGAAANIDDQPDASLFRQCAAGNGRGLRFRHELHVPETGREVAGAQISLGGGLAGVARAMEYYWPSRQNAVEAHLGFCLCTRFHLSEEAGDDFDEGHPLIQEPPGFMHQGGAQDAFERSHEAPLSALKQRLIGWFADQQTACIEVKEEVRGDRGLAGREGDETRPSILHIARGGV